MASVPGYAGKIVFLDLSDGSMIFFSTSKYATRFVDGRGMAAKIFWENVPTHIHAFDPENHLLFFTGPLAESPHIDSRWIVCGRSPTARSDGFACDSLGGNWGTSLRLAGFDGIVIHGKSERPVYLLIRDDMVEIMDATALWGKGAEEASKILRAELGKLAEVMAMGIAGEHLVPLASLQAGLHESESSGFGAVMGSKKLKAIVVVGEAR